MDTSLIKCYICLGEGWVCEFHLTKAWDDGYGCCGGAGTPCKCNKTYPPWHYMDTRSDTITQDKFNVN